MSTSAASSSTFTLTNLPIPNAVTPLQSSRHHPVEESLFIGRKFFPPGPLSTTNGELDCYMHNLPGLPTEWKQYVHVDGKPYFRHSDWGVVTEANVRNPVIRATIERYYRQIDVAQSTKHPQMDTSANHEIYLALSPKPGYYFVDHKLHSVFWLDELPLKQLGLSENSPAMSFELFIQRNYYCHLENFPIHNQLPDGAEESLRGALIYACADHMTSRDTSTASWNVQDCKTFLNLLDRLKDVTSAMAGYKTWFVSRLLCNILCSRWLYRYGMYEARTDRLAPLKRPRPRQTLDKLGDLISSVLFFRIPHTYADHLKKLWVDRIVSSDDWQRLLTSLMSEWSDSNLLAAVTLSANMAFLALSDINFFSRTASIASALFAIGSITIGLHHVWRHRTKVDTTAQHAAIYLENATRTVSSLNFLALFLSLPLILLSWSLVTFTFSITVYTFYYTHPWWNHVIVGVVLFAVVGIMVSSFLFFWGIFAARNKHEYDNV